MAFGSDFRIKYLMREVQRIVTEKLSVEGFENPLQLRVFDDDAGDNLLWDKGGLTFTTEEGNDAGSGDGAWYVEENWEDPISKKKSKFKPILVIEGTLGNEVGVVGDGQKTKLSHIFELPPRKILSAILMPKLAEYYSSGEKKGKPTPTYVQPGPWMKSLVMASISLSQKWNCETMFIDAYDKKQFEELVYALAKQQIQDNETNQEYRKKQIHEIMCEMNSYVYKYAKDYEAKSRRSNLPLSVLDLPMKDGIISPTWVAKIHSDDVKAFGITGQGRIKNPKARSRHRNGHRLLGNAQELMIITGKKTFLLLTRWNKNDLKKLKDGQGDEGGQKEFKNLQKNPDLDILTCNDIDFGNDSKLKKEFTRIRKVGIDLDAKLPEKDSEKLNNYCLKLKWGLYSKKYKIKR
jgi:hypothetical protein